MEKHASESRTSMSMYMLYGIDKSETIQLTTSLSLSEHTATWSFVILDARLQFTHMNIVHDKKFRTVKIRYYGSHKFYTSNMGWLVSLKCFPSNSVCASITH